MPGWSGCDVCVTGFEQTRGDLTTSIDQCRHLKLPERFTIEQVQRAQKDCEILGDKLRSTPEDMAAFLDSVLQNNTTDAKKRAHELGVTEEEFVKQGGGLLWLVVIVVLLYATDAY